MPKGRRHVPLELVRHAHIHRQGGCVDWDIMRGVMDRVATRRVRVVQLGEDSMIGHGAHILGRQAARRA